MIEIQRHLVLSTIHVDPKIGAMLDTYLAPHSPLRLRTPVQAVSGYAYEYGWFIWAETEDDFDTIPECLRDCMLFARKHNCDWLRFDADGPEIEELPQYEW